MSDIVLSITGTSVLEGTAAQFVVTLSEPSASQVRFNFLSFGGTADFAVDFATTVVGQDGLITIPAGQALATITVPTKADATDEADEDFFVRIYNPQGATLEGNVPTLLAQGIIRDNNGIFTPDANRGLFVDDVRVIEGNSSSQQAVFHVRLSQPSATPIIFNYTTVDGSAIAGEDYEARTGQVTFLAQQTEAMVSVPLIGDGVSEASERFSLVLTPTAAIANGVDDVEGTAEILDDDGDQGLPTISISDDAVVEGKVARFVVTMSEPSASQVRLNFLSLRGTADFAVDFATTVVGQDGLITNAPGATSAVIEVPTSGDTVNEADEDFFVELYNPIGAAFVTGERTLRGRGVILDDDGAASGDSNNALLVGDVAVLETDGVGQAAIFDVRLSRPSATAVTLNYTTLDASAVAGEDYETRSGQVTLLRGQTETAVIVPLIGDAVSEESEQFLLVVTPIVALANEVAGAEGIATILDDDSAPGLPVLSIAGDTVVEGKAARFVVTMSEPSLSQVRFQFLSSSGTASYGVDFATTVVGQDGLITIAPGATSAVIEVPTAGDATNEADEDFFVNIRNPSGAVLADDSVTLRAQGLILDDDGTVGADSNRALLVGDVSVLETNGLGQTAVFPVRLSTPATTALAFNYTTMDGSAVEGRDYEGQSGQVSFLPGQTVAAVIVPLIGDNESEGVEQFSLLVTPAGPVANGVIGAEGVAVILDDDSSQMVPVLSITGDTVIEGKVARFVVAMSEPSASQVRFNFQSMSGTADFTVDFATTVVGRSGLVTIAPGETTAIVEVPTAGDATNEADEDFFVEIFNPTGAALAGGAPGLRGHGIILDDDGVTSADSNRAFFIDDVRIVEGSTPGREAMVTVWLSRPAETIAAISYTTINGSALAGQDFEARSGQVTFQPGQTQASVVIPIIGDVSQELNETFAVLFSNAVGGVLGTRSSALVTIYDDDASGQLITGDGGPNSLVGGGGNDTISGLGGNDTLFGQQGDDSLSGGDGNDVIIGNDGNDVIDGGNGNDLITGDLAAVPGQGGSDNIVCGAGNDTVLCQEGADTVSGGDGADLIGIFAGQNISIDAGPGDDFIIGGFDLFGAANATIEGGQGNDVIVGGNQNDTFVYHSGFGPADLIYLFSQGIDKIRLAPNINNTGIATPAQAAAAVAATSVVGVGPAAALQLGSEIIYVVGLTQLQASDFIIG